MLSEPFLIGILFVWVVFLTAHVWALWGWVGALNKDKQDKQKPGATNYDNNYWGPG